MNAKHSVTTALMASGIHKTQTEVLSMESTRTMNSTNDYTLNTESVSNTLEMQGIHCPEMIKFVVAVLKHDPDGTINAGSGVLVRRNDRHYVATAEHCISGSDSKVRVALPESHPQKGNVRMRDLTIVDRCWSSDHDIGLLEIVDPKCAELEFASLDRSISDEHCVTVIGYPHVLLDKVSDIESQRISQVGFHVASFGTFLCSKSQHRLVLDYPDSVVRLEEDGWREQVLPKSPVGFSGGGCFQVGRASSSVVLVQYNLIGIQYEISPDGRSVYAVPISEWCKLVNHYQIERPR